MRFLLLFTLLFCFQSFLSGQSIQGTISDEYGTAIAEAHILNLSNDQHTHSNVNGAFQLKQVAVGDTILFSHVAYTDKFYIIKDLDKPIDLKLNGLPITINEVVITGRTNALEIISDIDLQMNPVNSSQDVLRKVPGLFIAQHAGGGKAEQIFLRGFDIDHGTDINITVDGLPVNMVSHSHGQGYSDLHFLIPETIDNIDFGKGPYYADNGNFTTAGYVGFNTKNELKNSSIKLEAGQFNTQRIVGMFNILQQEHHDAYIASEYIKTDGPFESPQNFNRVNVFGKYHSFKNNKRIGVTASHFSSSWDASGQIPVRAVEIGQITRFGAIDDTEGGYTDRTNILFNFDKIINNNSSLKNTVYFSRYNFELYSNFTFFLEDPINGDQIRQKENRNIYGLTSQYNKTFDLNNLQGNFIAGVSMRKDISKNNELSRTLNRRETLEQIQLGDIDETNVGSFVGAELNYSKWTFNPIVRLDYFNFVYNNALNPIYNTQSASKSIISPKLNILYDQSDMLQLYLKSGRGFHSNDTRAVVEEEGLDILPGAYGVDLGFIWKPTPEMLLNTAIWHLFLEQEFVYVGDAGIVEPSGRTQRQGIDISFRYQPLNSFYWNLDANYTYARSIDEESGQDFIPLAPDLTLLSGINYKHDSGFYSGANVRYLKNRPANEDNSIVAYGFTVVDLNVGYQWNKIEFGVQIQNLFDTDWNEAQFATESRLFDESEPVEEIHFTPGTPFFAKGMIQYNF